MSKVLVALAIAGAMSVPALAQTVPQATPQANAPQTTKPLTVKKKVCTRVDNEETTGSRLGSAPTVCKMVEVPAPQGSGTARGDQAPAPGSATGNNF